MKTTDLIYQNQKVLNALQEMLLQTKKHVECYPTNLYIGLTGVEIMKDK